MRAPHIAAGILAMVARVLGPRQRIAIVLLVLVWPSSDAVAAGIAPFAVAVDANAAGQAAIAWTRPDGVRVTTADHATGAMTAKTLAPTRMVAAPQVAVDDSGEVVVVWETYRLTGGGSCSTCLAHMVSDGVFAVLGRVASRFGAPVRIAGPRTDTGGAAVQLADPQLAMDAQGRAIVAGSAASGTWVASRDPLGPFGAAQRAATDFTVTGAALGRNGEVLLTDVRSRVVTRPPGGAFGSPVALPGANTPYGPGALIAADGGGDAVALYGGGSSVLASRRSLDGAWSPPTVLTTVSGASGRAVAVAGDGTAVATFAQTDRDPREGGHTALMATTLRPNATATTAQLNPAGTDGDVLAGDLDADATGRFALAFSQAPTLIAPGDALVTVRAPGGDFGTPALLTSGRFQLGNVARVALIANGVLATWTEHANSEDRLLTRWLPGGPALTLDHAAAVDRTPPLIAPHTLQLTTQPTRRPDRRGRILVGLRCFSTDRSSCAGTLRLTAGPRRWTAGRTRYAIGPNAVHRARMTLTARARRALRRQGRITLTARGVPGRIVVVSPRPSGHRAAARAGRAASRRNS